MVTTSEILLFLVAVCLICEAHAQGRGRFGGRRKGGRPVGRFGGFGDSGDLFGCDGGDGLGDCQATQAACDAAPITLDKVPPFNSRYSFLAPFLLTLPGFAAPETCNEWCVCLTGATGTGACVESKESPINWWNWFDNNNDDCPAGQWKCQCTPEPNAKDALINVAVKRCVVP